MRFSGNGVVGRASSSEFENIWLRHRLGDVGAVQRAQGETRYLRGPNLRSFSALLKYDTGFSPRL